jgi:hypothetical protein
MERSREYVLNRLDRWYADQVKRNYTPEVAQEYRDRVLGSLEHPDSLSKVEEILAKQDAFDPEVMVQYYSSFFSNFWNAAEQSFSGLELDVAAAPEGVRVEYFEPFMKVFQTLTSMVDSVRSLSNDVFPDELSDGQVRDALFKPVGGLEGYCNFSGQAIKAFNAFQNVTDLFEEDWIKDYLNACERTTEDFNRLILRE